MRDLLDPSKTPKVPKDIRRRAYSVLKHFPSDLDMDYAAAAAPDTFTGKPWYPEENKSNAKNRSNK